MTTQTEHAPFPTDETLAAYIDGRLDDETRRHVVEHIAECPECFDAVQVSQEMTTAAPVAQVIRWPRNALIGLGTAAVIGTLLMLTPVREVLWPPDDLRTLAKVAPPERRFEGRVTGFPYQKFYRSRGGGNDQDQDDRETELDGKSLAFQSVAGQAIVRAMEHPNARTLHAEGVAYLELHEWKKAVEALEKARDSSARRDPQVLSDLATAYIETQQYKEAMQAAEDAWALAKTPEIAWNRAMTAQRAGRLRDAIAAWNVYLSFKDESPEWRQAAEKNLADAKEALQNRLP